MIVVLIAAYNEEPALERVLTSIPASSHGLCTRTVVVSDGSTDRTVAIAEEAGARVIELPTNRGKGAALRTGFDDVLVGSQLTPIPEVVVLMDADGQHDPSDMADLVGPVIAGRHDTVVGSRYLLDSSRGTAPWNRYVVRSVVTWFMNRLCGRGITDPFSGFRAMTIDAARHLTLRGDRYQCELEMLFSAHEHGLDVAEVPIAKSYGPNCSKMGVHHGKLIGRISVVVGYLMAILAGGARIARSQWRGGVPAWKDSTVSQ